MKRENLIYVGGGVAALGLLVLFSQAKGATSSSSSTNGLTGDGDGDGDGDGPITIGPFEGVTQGSAQPPLEGVTQGSAQPPLEGVTQGSAQPPLEGVTQGSAQPPGSYAPSATVCGLDGQPYNAALFMVPADVANAYQSLGYDVSVNDLAKQRKRTTIKKFQRRARDLMLPGYAGAPNSWIDGLTGECTLRSLEAALDLLDRGAWSKK